MKPELYAWDERSFSDKIRLPSEWFFDDKDQKRADAKAAARKTVRDEEVVVLGDADADGLGGVAVVREYYDAEVPFVPCGPHGADLYMGDALWVCVDDLKDGATVIIQDVCVDAEWKVKALPKVAEKAGEILWFDHHEWDDDVAEFVRQHVDVLEIDTGTDDADAGVFEARCGAMMLRDYYEASGHSFSESFNELVDVTGEYDLWRLRDDRCFDLNDLSHVVDHDEYVTLVRTHGADIMNDERAAEDIAEYREEQTALHDAAIDNAEYVDVGPWTVATVYGNCPANDVAESMRERGLADVCAFIKPHGGMSFRGSENFERCHEVAEAFSGGGHPKAAGGYAGDHFTSLMDYAEHWTTDGEAVKELVMDAFRDLAPEQTA